MSLTSSEMTPADIAAVTGNGNDWGGGNGSWWIIVLFLFALMGNGWGNGFGGFGGNGGAVPYIGATADVQRGFDQSAIMSSLNSLATGQCNQTATLQNAITQGQIASMQGFNGIQNQLCNCCFDMSNAVNGGVAALQNTMMQNEMARQNCCCETKQAIADLKYTVATENCADRQALSDGVRDIIASNTAQTQAILDKLCQQEIDAKNETIANLRTQLNMQNLAASQTAQTAAILANNAAQTQALEQYLNPSPIPAYVVQNPNCCVNNGCGCGIA